MSVGNQVLLEVLNLSKDYFGVPALKNVSFKVRKGEIHGLIGENGAGKSTLIKIISGAIQPTSGDITFENKSLSIKRPIDAIEQGIGVVYQEFNLFPNLTVYENIFFGIELKKNSTLNRSLMIKKAKEIILDLGFDFDVTQQVKRLSTALQQVTEIAKCLIHKLKLIIMDEPSAPLTDNEVDDLFKVIRRLNDQGVTIVYISHKLNEILEITDRVTVLRDGQFIKTVDTSEADESILIKYMVGRDIADIYPLKTINNSTTILEVKNLCSNKIKNVSFHLKKGEILGFGGLVGAGRTEVMRLIFGADKIDNGEIIVNNQKIKVNRPQDAIQLGIGLIPEDRKLHGLILNKSIFMNCLLPSINEYSNTLLGNIDFKKSDRDIRKYYDKLQIRATSTGQIVQTLSGGNQQKVVLGKWMLRNCEILILDEPTRGVDVGAKQEIYQLISQLSNEGKSIIVISSEMPELIGLSHRVMVMRDGRITGELVGSSISQEKIMELASFGEENAKKDKIYI